MANVTMRNPSGITKATLSDGTSVTINSTGVAVVDSKYIPDMEKMGFTLATDLTIVGGRYEFSDDFVGSALGSAWTARDTAAATEAVTAAANGVLALSLDATNEIQLAGVDWNNLKSLEVDLGIVTEFRFRFTTLPTTGTTGLLGFGGSHNAALASVSPRVGFTFADNGAITVTTADGTTTNSAVSTGVTLVANQWCVGRIDASAPTGVLFYLDGNRVASGTTFNINGAPTATAQPIFRIGKESAGTNVGVLQIDYVTISQNRSAS